VKEIRDKSVIKVRCTVDSAPRDIYLVKDLDLVKKLFTSAYILKRVAWHKIGNFYSFMAGTELDEIIPYSSRYCRSSNKITKAKKDIEENTEKFKKDILSMYTVIPFAPSVKDFKEKSKTWTIPNDLMILPGNRNINRSRYSSYGNQASAFYSVLLQNSHDMGLLIEGVYYETPCKLCEFLMSKLAGDCQIYMRNSMGVHLCTPRLNFNTQLFKNREVSTLQDVDYAEVITMWNDNQKMEV
jgi:hypothetical protein